MVVTDPHFNALVSHEVIGHPCEADRALKMEAAYAGRSWFLRSLKENQLGKPVASPLLSACSDPSLDGYGQYRYDHEGTRGRRVTHVDRGIFQRLSQFARDRRDSWRGAQRLSARERRMARAR